MMRGLSCARRGGMGARRRATARTGADGHVVVWEGCFVSRDVPGAVTAAAGAVAVFLPTCVMALGRRGVYARGTNSSTGPALRWHPGRKAAAARGPSPRPKRMPGVIGPGPPAWSTSILGARSSGRWGRGPAAKRRANSRRRHRRRWTSPPGTRGPASRTGPLASRDRDDGHGREPSGRGLERLGVPAALEGGRRAGRSRGRAVHRGPARRHRPAMRRGSS